MAHFVKLSGINDIGRGSNGETYTILVNIDNIVSIGRAGNGNYTILNTANNSVLRVTEDLDTVAKLCGCVKIDYQKCVRCGDKVDSVLLNG